MEKKQPTKKPLLNINTTAIKNVVKSKEVRDGIKTIWNAVKSVTDTLDSK